VDLVVIEDEHDALRTAIALSQLDEHLEEQNRVLSMILDPSQSAGACMQGTGDVMLLILSGGRNGFLAPAFSPPVTDARIEVDVFR
jgi:hypothetical protein